MLPHFLALYPLSIWLKVLIAKGFGFVQQALIRGKTPPQTPPRRGERLRFSPFPPREGGWGVRSSKLAKA